MDEIPSDWVFTFGLGTPYKDKYVVVHGTFNEARIKLMDKVGVHFAFQYSMEEFIPQISKYDLKEISIDSL
jgi:hypothetical protein